MNNLIKTYENNFNPHSHEGSDTGRIKRVRRMVHFNPHSHEGSDLLSLVALLALLEISIHTPTKGATKAEAKVRQHISNFNPHSHEGSDDEEEVSALMSEISIHTPTKGATVVNFAAYEDATISIHTPTKGATNILDEAIGITN